MFESSTEIRVRYAETDQMGYVYYGRYAEYLEVARVEALRSLGLSYRSLEKQGVMLPVRRSNIEYYRPAFYDEVLTVVTHILEIPKTRIFFSYQILNSKKIVISEAETTLVFIDTKTRKPCPAPTQFLELIQPYF